MTENNGHLAGEEEAREIAESARETEWQHSSFVRELFLGRFRLDLIHPHPESDPEEEARAKPFMDKLRAFLERVDSDEIDRTGILPPLGEGAFNGFCHRPGELRDEIAEAGLEVADLVSVEGPAFILGDLDARMADPVDRSVALTVARAIERVPELTGFGPHLIATGIRS